MKHSLYAWWNCPAGLAPEFNCPAEHHAIQIVPGMGQWMLVHLKQPLAEVKDGLIPAKFATEMLENQCQTAL